MSLKSLVKVSHLSNLSDARYCAGMGVELLGFRVIPGAEHYMPPAIFQDIRGWISGPKIIAELYGITSPEQLQTAIEIYAPDYLELTFDEFNTFQKHVTLPCIVSFSVASEAKKAGDTNGISYIILDEQTTCEDVSSIGYSVLVNVGSLESLVRKMEAGCFQGYVLQGTQELRPGVTNYDQLGVILEALEE